MDELTGLDRPLVDRLRRYADVPVVEYDPMAIARRATSGPPRAGQGRIEHRSAIRLLGLAAAMSLAIAAVIVGAVLQRPVDHGVGAGVLPTGRDPEMDDLLYIDRGQSIHMWDPG